jgi:biopolymer transport protein ExbD
MADLNIIPLVDVTLVILIIFMVTTSFEKPGKQKTEPPLVLPVELPAATAAVESPDTVKPLVLGVDSSGQKYIGAQPTTTEGLHAAVREAVAKDAKLKIQLDADRATRFEDIIEVINLCQIEGIHNVALHTRDRDSQ